MEFTLIIKEQITELVRNINNKNHEEVTIMTQTLIKYILTMINTDTKTNISNHDISYYIGIIYKLIFHVSTTNDINMSLNILNGFIRFSETNEGLSHKPLIDHFIIEATNVFLHQEGWSIINHLL